MSTLPRRVKVKELISGRYPAGSRPVSWDERRSGTDVIVTEKGEQLTLFDSGGQSTPAPGWEILLMKETSTNPATFSWTLYGIAP